MICLYCAHMRRTLTAAASAVLVLTGSSCAAGDQASRPPAATTAAPATPSVVPTTAATTTPAPAATTEPAEPKLGEKQETALGTATVYAVKFPVKAQDDTATRIRDEGMQFAVADIKVCANGSVDEDGYGFDASDFVLIDADSRAYEFWNVQVSARSPNLTDTLGFGTDTPRAGSCKRGWLTFQVPPKTKIVSVEYNSSAGSPLVWQVR